MTPERHRYVALRLARLADTVESLTRTINLASVARPVDREVIEKLMKRRRSALGSIKRWQKTLERELRRPVATSVS
jgi:hypothetical protein